MQMNFQDIEEVFSISVNFYLLLQVAEILFLIKNFHYAMWWSNSQNSDFSE
jgi:hypothetical protein